MKFPNAIQITAVKTSNPEETVTPLVQLPSPDDVAEYATIAAYWTKQSAKGVAVLYLGKKVVDLTTDIARVAIASRVVS